MTAHAFRVVDRPIGVRVYAEAADARIGHLRTKNTHHEIDLIVEAADTPAHPRPTRPRVWPKVTTEARTHATPTRSRQRQHGPTPGHPGTCQRTHKPQRRHAGEPPQPPETGIPHGEPVGNWPNQPRKKPLPDSHPDHSTRHQPLPQAFPAPGTENRREVLTSRRFPVFALVRGLFVRERGVEALFYQPTMTP